MAEKITRATQHPDLDLIFDLIWGDGHEGYRDGMDCADLDESLGDPDEGTHPWHDMTYGYDLNTFQTYAQTLETPAEYHTDGSMWVMDYLGREIAKRDAGDYQ